MHLNVRGSVCGSSEETDSSGLLFHNRCSLGVFIKLILPMMVQSGPYADILAGEEIL